VERVSVVAYIHSDALNLHRATKDADTMRAQRCLLESWGFQLPSVELMEVLAESLKATPLPSKTDRVDAAQKAMMRDLDQGKIAQVDDAPLGSEPTYVVLDSSEEEGGDEESDESGFPDEFDEGAPPKAGSAVVPEGRPSSLHPAAIPLMRAMGHVDPSGKLSRRSTDTNDAAVSAAVSDAGGGSTVPTVMFASAVARCSEEADAVVVEEEALTSSSSLSSSSLSTERSCEQRSQPQPLVTAHEFELFRSNAPQHGDAVNTRPHHSLMPVPATSVRRKATAGVDQFNFASGRGAGVSGFTPMRRMPDEHLTESPTKRGRW